MVEPTFFIDFIVNMFSAFKTGGPSFFGEVGAIAPYVKGFLSFLSLLFITGTIYSLVRIWEIGKEEEAKYHIALPTHHPESHAHIQEWENIERHIHSTNQAEWRVAIIEADRILEDIIAQIGYTGETLADRLKQVEKSDIRSIQSAWDAHKVRNKIAHEGSAFNLDHRTARQTIEQYRQVFEELGYLPPR